MVVTKWMNLIIAACVSYTYVTSAVSVAASSPMPLIVGCSVPQIYDDQLSKIQAVLVRKINEAIRSEIETLLNESDELAPSESRYPVSRPVTHFFVPCASLYNLQESFFDVVKEECLLLKKIGTARGQSFKAELHVGSLELKGAYVQLTLRGQFNNARAIINRFKTACVATDVLQQATANQAIGGMQEDTFDPVIQLVALPYEELQARSLLLWERVQQRITATIIPKIIVPEITLQIGKFSFLEKKQPDRYAMRYMVSIE